MMDTNFEEESQNVKHRLVHSFLYLRVSLTSGVKCSKFNNMQQRFQCHLYMIILETIQLFKSIIIDRYWYDWGFRLVHLS